MICPTSPFISSNKYVEACIRNIQGDNVVENNKHLVRRVQAGDRNAASELLWSVYHPTYAYLRRLCGSEVVTEDLMQETFVKVWSSLPAFRNECTFSTWVHRIAFNTYIDWYRSAQREIIVFTPWVNERIDPRPDPCVETTEGQEAERIFRAVETLDEPLRQVVHLHFYQDLSLRETAYVLSIAVSTVKYRLRRAIDELKPILDI